MPERLGAVSRFLLPPEHPHDAALRVEANDHVRAFVDGPDVVVPIDAHAVRLRPGIETLADLAYEIAVLIEFEELGRGAPNAGPFALFEREKTNTWPLEFTATPGTSPKFMPAGRVG
jgi:hypothetical protein